LPNRAAGDWAMREGGRWPQATKNVPRIFLGTSCTSERGGVCGLSEIAAFDRTAERQQSLL
jgi:hypothetical protein